MYYKIEVINNSTHIFAITNMLHQSLAESAGHYWWTAEFENVANPDFKIFKHLQNPEHYLLTAPIIRYH